MIQIQGTVYGIEVNYHTFILEGPTPISEA